MKSKLDIQFFGDFYTPWHILKKTKSSVHDPRLLKHVQPLFEQSENNIINFEGVMTGAFFPGIPYKKYLLRMPLWTAKLLKPLNVTLATLGNNHSFDLGYQGVFDTWSRFEEQSIQVIGAGRNLTAAMQPGLLMIGGQSVCIISFNRTLPEDFWAKENAPGTAYMNFTKTAAVVKRYAGLCDVVIPVFHWGSERKTEPKAYQKTLAKLVIDNGAAAVIGHHPHVIQTITSYKGRPILYSLGNSIFGTKPFSGKSTGVAVGMQLGKGRIKEIVVTGLDVDNNEVLFVPKISDATRDMKPYFSKEFWRICKKAKVKHSQTVCDLTKSRHYPQD